MRPPPGSEAGQLRNDRATTITSLSLLLAFKCFRYEGLAISSALLHARHETNSPVALFASLFIWSAPAQPSNLSRWWRSYHAERCWPFLSVCKGVAGALRRAEILLAEMLIQWVGGGRNSESATLRCAVRGKHKKRTEAFAPVPALCGEPPRTRTENPLIKS
jgi:hypothetical protein